MKKFLTLLMGLIFLPQTVMSATTTTSINGISYRLDSTTNTAEVIGNSNNGLVIIPSTVDYNSDTYTVTNIGANSFSEGKKIYNIIIPNTVNTIGDGAFYNCSDLLKLTIPNSVTSIGQNAFYGCSSLSKIEIPSSLNSIGWGVFQYCTNLKSVVIPTSITSIGYRAFRGCSSLCDIQIPTSVTSIGTEAFANCNSLKNIIIPNLVKSIETSTFFECTGLTNIEIPNSVTSISTRAFNGCVGLTTVKIPNSVTSIGEQTFKDCIGLTSVEIPNSVTSIGEQAFAGCTNLEEVIIPNSVTQIGANAFSNQSLRYIYNYATEPQVISSNVFDNVAVMVIELYVPEASIEKYKTAKVWKDFHFIQPIEEVVVNKKTQDKTNKIQYLDNDGYEINNHAVSLSLPLPEQKEGYQFLKWTVLQGDLDEGIRVQAQYIGEGTEKNLFYLDKEGEEMHSHSVTLSLPEPEEIPGYTFQKWVVVGGDLDDGIHVQAQYIDDGVMTEVSSAMEDGSISPQKVIRKGQVFILKGDKVYDVSGKEMK